LILTDYTLPYFDGMAALRMHQQIAPEIPLIIFSGTIGEEVAVECVKSGAADYVLKDNISRLGPIVKRALEEAEARRERKRMQEHIQHLNSVLKAIRHVNRLIVKEKDRDSLLRKASDVLVDARGYDGAWLGYLSNEKTFATVVGSGLGEDVSRFIEHVIDGDHPPCIEKALDRKDLLMIMDKSRECGDCFFSSACIGKEAAIIRVEDGGKLYGLLAVLFAPGVSVDDEEKELLKEVAGDIALGLYNMDLVEAHKQAEEALRESEKKYRRIFENIQDVYYEANLDGTVLEISPSIENVSQYKRKELVGMSLYDIYTNPKERDGFLKLILDRGRVNDFEISLKDKDGSKRPCSITTLLVKDEEGNPIKLVGSMRDISERKQSEGERKKLEAQLQQTQKMEAIGTLAGGVAHDFNNILTTIIGNADLALMDVIKDESLRKEIEEIKIAGERAAALTRQLLAFSRKQIIQPKVLDLNELLTGLEKMLGRLIGEDVEVLMIPEAALWRIEIDPGQMEQVIMNLVVNARDAMPQGGKLTIETANVDLDKAYFRDHVAEGKTGHYVTVAVSDTGIGMDKETQSRIFEPFFTTKERGGGTGLGLSTVYGIVKQSGGFIWAYSEPGQGTTFKVYLPKVAGDAEPEEKEKTSVVDLTGSETVLIVEDDDSLLNLARKILQLLGYTVLKAENGEEALKVSEEHKGPIHLLLTDVVLPGMGGGELAECIQSHRPETKVLYMSGYTDDAIAHQGVLAPGVNFLEKPFTMEGLAKKVREALDK